MKAADFTITPDTTFSQLKALVPDASDQKMQGRTLIKSDIPKLITVEDSGLTISVYSNGFFTAQDESGRVTARAVWNCEAMTFEKAVGKPESVTEEVYGSLPFPMVLSQFGQMNLDHAADEREAYNAGISLNAGNVKETKELQTEDFSDQVIAKVDGEPNEVSVLKKAWSTLTEKQREVMELCYVKGLTWEAAADKLGISRDSVADRISGAKKKLSKFF